MGVGRVGGGGVGGEWRGRGQGWSLTFLDDTSDLYCSGCCTIVAAVL